MKDGINREFVSELSTRINGSYREFKSEDFINCVVPKLDGLELFQRIDLIVEELNKYLPKDYPEALNILVNSLGPELPTDCDSWSGEYGFITIVFTGYVSKYGLDYFEISMNALYEMTKRLTSEGAVRHFIIKYPNKSLEVFRKWARDDNMHVRRLVSEGLRPRLPWAIRLQNFIKAPEPIIEFLDILKDDSSLYVRRSVANNLNDISKDHPDLVIETLKRWSSNRSKEMNWLIKHALRTLIKKGNKDALEILGFEKNPQIETFDFKYKKEMILEDSLDISFILNSLGSKDQNIIIDYIILHKKANGSLSPKVFKLKTLTIKPGESVLIKKNHIIREVTTRKYYSGEHQVVIQINGSEFLRGKFNLSL